MSFNKKSLPEVDILKKIVEENPGYVDILMKADMVIGSTESMKYYEEQVALRQLAKHDTEVTDMTSQRDTIR
jgi:hypothetical protein